MRQYQDVLSHILNEGTRKENRTGIDTISTFGYQTRYNLKEGFPLVTTKKLHLRSIIHELLWMISGNTNIEYLVQNGVSIWNDWPFESYKNSTEYQNETIKEFAEKVKTDHEFALKWGDLGPVYGSQWRHFTSDTGAVDQLMTLMDSLKNNPDSRRHIISAWHPAKLKDMALPPCHAFFQFYIHDGALSCQLYQRSADAFLGVPFNIAFYALFTMMIADVLGLEVGEFIHTLGDAHIYVNHIDQVNLQLSREPYPLPKMKIKHRNSILEFKYDDFELVDYQAHPHIKGEVAV